MTINTQLRKQLFPDQALGDHARDTQGVLDAMPRFVTKTLVAFYTEPMVLSSAAEPESIELTRIIPVRQSEKPVLCGSMVHYAWKPQQGGSVISSIDGLTPNSAIQYKFTFRLTFPAAGAV